MEKYLPTQLIGPTRLLISEKTFTYTIIRSYTIIWQVRVLGKGKYVEASLLNWLVCKLTSWPVSVQTIHLAWFKLMVMKRQLWQYIFDHSKFKTSTNHKIIKIYVLFLSIQFPNGIMNFRTLCTIFTTFANCTVDF